MRTESPAALRRIARASVVAALVVLGAGTSGLPKLRAAAKPLHCDFDGDGRSDLAAGVPGDNKLRGAVNVQYSSGAFGAYLDLGAYLQRAHVAVELPGTSSAKQRLGSGLGCGDFDGDSFADLAIGVPGEHQDTGAVVVAYGSPLGLTNKHDTYLTQTHLGLGGLESGDHGDSFGEALAAGDFNGDGFDDLAIGVPAENVATFEGVGKIKSLTNVGLVHIVFGSESAGLGLVPSVQTFWPFKPGLCCFQGQPQYGAALAAGDFNDDGVDDLAVGAPFADTDTSNSEVNAGAVHLMRGEAGTGIVLTGQQYLYESLLTNLTQPREGERFGTSLAAGQFDGLRGDDLAIGAPLEKLNGDDWLGIVWVLYFAGNGLVPTTSDFFLDVPPVGPGLQAGERFGWALAAGNFDGLHEDDLAIGIPLKITDLSHPETTSGAVAVVFSDGSGLVEAGAQYFFPGDFAHGVQTPPPAEGQSLEFGYSLAAGDYHGDGVTDLFIGVPGLPLAVFNAGGVEIRPGVAAQALPGPSYLLLTQDTFQPGKTWSADENKFGFSNGFDFCAGERMGHALAR